MSTIKVSNQETSQQDKLASSFIFCQENAKQNSNFYLGILFASADKRKAVFAIYAWLHAVDDVADTNESIIDRIKKLDLFYKKTCAVLDSPSDEICDQYKESYWLAFRHSVHNFQIPRVYLEEMIAGQRQDLIKNHYQTFLELYEYCRFVASSVGLMCITIWGYTDAPHARILAEECGVALQLTNILRDLQADVILQRVYLPLEYIDSELSSLTAENFYQVPEEDLLSGIQKLIHKAQYYYDHSFSLYKYIHRDGRVSFLMLVESYFAIFKKICQNPSEVLHGKKFRLTRFDKAKILLKVLMKHYAYYWR